MFGVVCSTSLIVHEIMVELDPVLDASDSLRCSGSSCLGPAQVGCSSPLSAMKNAAFELKPRGLDCVIESDILY
jgi:hypothetical protein